MKIITAKEAKELMTAALENYNMDALKGEVAIEIYEMAAKGGNKIYHHFSDEVPDNAKVLLVNYLCDLGYDANLPVADKTKIRISWKV